MAELVITKSQAEQARTSLLKAPALSGRRARGRRLSFSFWLGACLVAWFLVMVVAAPWLAAYPMDQVAAAARLQAPSAAHPFGTDSLGRDQFSRVVYGARIALEVSLLGLAIAGGLGIPLGLLAGYRGGWVDQLLSRLVDILLALPGLLLAILIVARLGPSLHNAALALGVVGVPSFYRLARSGALSVCQAPYVEAARSLGCADGRVLLRHVLPNVAPSLVVLATMRVGVLILAGGGLSFIGLGAQPPQPEWGALLAAGRDYMGIAPWLAIFPGLCITATVVGFNLLGDGLGDLLNPQSCGPGRRQ